MNHSGIGGVQLYHVRLCYLPEFGWTVGMAASAIYPSLDGRLALHGCQTHLTATSTSNCDEGEFIQAKTPYDIKMNGDINN